jgi:class 3 adenylate cyclase
VLFADLVGFTTLSEDRDPEETRELLTQYFSIAREVVSRHGGTIEKFIGDAVMAVWGAPVARENDAELAVRAAMALVDGVKSLGPDIRARAGVLTGEAAVTLGATGEGMVAGDLVNTASRLQSVAPQGAVLVGEATERAANQAIVFERATDQVLKGKAAPVAAYRAVRIVAEVGGRNRAETLEAPFVGRDDDFRQLTDLFHATTRDRRPRLVSVMGPAGIGKSRLAWEFSKYTDGLVDNTYWHIGRSPSYGEGISLWALGEMVRRRAELLESDDDATTRQKLATVAQEWAKDDNERRWLETALLALLGLGDPPAGGRDELFSAWRTFFQRIAERGTTVLLFEDLQWADSGLVDFIEYLIDSTRALPLFVLTLARPELLERRPEWGAGRRSFVSMTLDPLPDEAMRELLAGLVPGLPKELLSTIVARADGVPLYAVETVRMLLSEGKVLADGDSYRPATDLTTLAVPETLAALVAARLDSLGSEDRSLLQDAAVLGQSFSAESAGALSARKAEDVQSRLRTLVRRQLLALDNDPRSPERGRYTFVQAIVREVAYNQLARDERKVRHLAAARWFETRGDDELAGVLAEHYLAAQRNARPGPEADALAGQSRLALRAAADRAASLGSHPLAETYVLSAVALTADPVEQAALYARAGDEASDASPLRAREHYEKAAQLYRDAKDLRGLAEAVTGISVVLQMVYRPADALPVLEEAVALMAPIEEEPEAIRLESELGRVYANLRDPRALAMADRVLAKADQRELVPVVAEALLNRALAIYHQGRLYETMAIVTGVIALADRYKLRRTQWRAINNLSVGLIYEDMAAAAALVRSAAERAAELGSPGQTSYFQGLLTAPLLYLGDWDELARLMAEIEEAGGAGGRLEYAQINALYLALRGDFDAVDRLIERLRQLLAGASLATMSVNSMLLEGQILALRGDLDESHTVLSDAMNKMDTHAAAEAAMWAASVAFWMGEPDLVREASQRFLAMPTPGRMFRLLRTQARGNLAAVDGRLDEALTLYREAARGWRESGVDLSLGLLLTDMAVAFDRSIPEVAAAAQEARAIWTRLGSPPMLARLDQPVVWNRPGPDAPVPRAKGDVRAEESASA